MGKGSIVLVVEDERIIAKDITDSLHAHGYRVAEVVGTGEEAIEAAGAHKPDIVLMDIMLQGRIDGIEAARRIRAEFNIPIIYLTAYADEGILERARATEPFGYMIKPFEETEMHFTIEMALFKHKAEIERERLIGELREALAHIKTLHGLLPICAWCKKIRDDKGYWSQVEEYLADHSDTKFTHGICPDCQKRLERELSEYK